MFFFAIAPTLTALAVLVLLIRKIYQRWKPLDSYSKSQIIDKALKMRSKSTNYKDFKEMLSNSTLKNNKLLPVCIEMVDTIHQIMPKYTPPKQKKRFRFRKFSVPRISVSAMEKAMDSECIEFSDFEDDLDIDFVSNNDFDSSKITVHEFNNSFKKNAVNKLDFMKLSKIHLQSIPNYLKQRLINIFNNMIWSESTEDGTEDQIKEHAVGISYLIYKESKQGPLDEKSSYRTITTIPVIVNCFHRILAIRFAKYFLEQHKIIDTTIHKGAIPNIKYGVLEQIVKVKNIVRMSNSAPDGISVGSTGNGTSVTGNPAHIMFVDISNAFPSVNIKKLLTLMYSYEVDPKIVDYIESYYENLEYKAIISRNKSTKLKPWKQGLIQGCPMSPILFIIIMNYVTKTLSDMYLSTYGYNLFGIPIMFTAFLDDICIITNSAEGLETVFTEMKSMFEMFNLQINMDKTKILSIETTSDDGTSDNRLENIEYVDKATYLGETIELDPLLSLGYKNIYKFLIKKLYRTDKASYSKERKIEVFLQYILPWLHRKLIVYYDFSVFQKTNLRKTVYYFLSKWGYKEKIGFQNTLASLMASSDDPYIKEILKDPFTVKVDADTTKLEDRGKMVLINYRFRY